jgi:hypothetical protein
MVDARFGVTVRSPWLPSARCTLHVEPETGYKTVGGDGLSRPLTRRWGVGQRTRPVSALPTRAYDDRDNVAAQVARLCGEEWQRWANKLLTTHFGASEYQTIPDNDKGDAGLDGFTITKGEAFQAYGCEEPVSTQQRYEAQRKKITRDIKKFIDNQAVLQRIFGGVRITRWILFVPHFDSKEIVAHAATKTDEVLGAKLPYVAIGFRVIVSQEDDFAVARDQLIGAGSRKLTVTGATTSAAEQDNWASSHHDLAAKLDLKLKKVPTIASEEQRQAFRKNVLKWHLDGQAIHQALRAYPEVYEKVVRTKAMRENGLAMTLMSEDTAQSILRASMTELREAFEREVHMLSNLDIDSLTYEAVADWLLRCPLDFPEKV